MFQISCELPAHQQDVKCVHDASIASDQTRMVTCSRDSHVKLWSLAPSGGEHGKCVWTLEKEHCEHSRFVNAVTFIGPSVDYAEGLVVSAGSDKLIHAYDPASSRVIATLIGHEENVCMLSVCKDNRILSASWDKTGRVWDAWNCTWTLSGHESAVWAIRELAPNTFLTASADKTIKKWRADHCVHTFRGHTDCVRDICILSSYNVGADFASAGNDGTIRLWQETGECLATIAAHSAFIYSLAVLSNGHLVSAGEDRCIKIWNLKTRECLQSLPVPTFSLWSLAILANGDISCGTSSASVCIFTQDPQRHAGNDELNSFNERMKNVAINKSTIGDIDVEKLVGVEALSQPGKKEGQILMIKKNGAVEAYQWSNGQWIKVGDVVDAVGSVQKQTFEGKEYDYVFDIEVEEGGHVLKLPYNCSDNPFTAASNFMQKNDLPMHYLEEIANFIIKNSETKVIGPAADHNADPYRDNGQKERVKPAMFMTQYALHTSANLAGIKKKITEFNGQLQSGSKLILAEDEIARLNDLCDLKSMSEIGPAHLELFTKLMQWPMENLFPVLDLFRALICDAKACSLLLCHSDKIWSSLDRIDASPGVSVASPCVLMKLRVICNMFSTIPGRNTIIRDAQKNIIFLRKCSHLQSKAQLALSGAIFNYALLSSTDERAFSLVDGICALILSRMRLISEAEDVELCLGAIHALLPRMSKQIPKSLLAELEIVRSASGQFPQAILQLIDNTIDEIKATLRPENN